MAGVTFHERDERPAKGGWAPGTYFCLCLRCKEQFFGEKRAMVCANCVYSASETPPQSSQKPLDVRDEKAVWDRIAENRAIAARED